MYLGGYPYNINIFLGLLKKYNFLIIEDACHASYRSRYEINNKKYMVN